MIRWLVVFGLLAGISANANDECATRERALALSAKTSAQLLAQARAVRPPLADWDNGGQRAYEDALRPIYHALEMKYATEAGRREMDELLMQRIRAWQEPGKYPEGVTPELWKKNRESVSSPETFFKTMPHGIFDTRQITKAYLDRTLMSASLIAGGNENPKWAHVLSDGVETLLLLRISATYHHGRVPDDVKFP